MSETLAAVAAGLAVLAGLVAAFAVFQPWVRTSVEAQSGWANGTLDAKVVLVLALLAIGLGGLVASGRRDPLIRLALAGTGVALMAIAFVDVTSVQDLDPLLQAHTGAGLTMIPVAGALIVIAAAVAPGREVDEAAGDPLAPGGGAAPQSYADLGGSAPAMPWTPEPG